MVALAEKGLEYQQNEILPSVLMLATGQEIPEAFADASPLGRIPAIDINGVQLADSAVIAGYLDRQFVVGTALYLQDSTEYARALWFEHYSDTVLTAVSYQKIFLEGVVKPSVLKSEPDLSLTQQALSVELPPLLEYLDQHITNHAWFSGDAFSMADIAIATQLLALNMYDSDIIEKFPNLKHHLEKTTQRKSFKKILS